MRSVVTESAAPAQESAEVVAHMITIVRYTFTPATTYQNYQHHHSQPPYPLTLRIQDGPTGAHQEAFILPQQRQWQFHWHDTAQFSRDIPHSSRSQHLNSSQVDHDAALRTRLMPDQRRAFFGTEHRNNCSFQRRKTAQLAKLWSPADAHGRRRLKALRPRTPPDLQRKLVVPPQVPRPVKRLCVAPSHMPQEIDARITASTSQEKEEQKMGVESLYSLNEAGDFEIGYLYPVQESNSDEEVVVGAQSTGPLHHVNASEEVSLSPISALVGSFAENRFLGEHCDAMEGHSQDLPSQFMPEAWPSLFPGFLSIDMLQNDRDDSPMECLS
ncbi:hypothetical protein BKA63DRAFT_495046 [Paraphoma chrysanthemicola]|nr:hypothetical protein BKA63DRAFT_495046 [Paraphoma chrysanthemicola]